VIVRLWHGWTTPANADAYERLLKEEIFRGIARRAIPGYRGIELLRRPAGRGVEFVTVMRLSNRSLRSPELSPGRAGPAF
jgi:antibiotic biosynthesis monooxygenase (ABM) superfamily enzyme